MAGVGEIGENTVRRRVNDNMIVAIVAAGIFAYALLQSLVIPVLPIFERQLHTSQDAATWILTAYLLSASVCTPIIGRLGDRFGKDRMFTFAVGGLAVGSLLGAIAPNIGVMIGARVIQGIGGGVIPVAFGIVRDEFPPARVPGIVGFLAALAGIGGGVGLVLAGPILEALNYHWLHWLPLIVALTAAVAAYFFIPRSAVRSEGKISVTPALMLSAWLITLLLALSQAPTWGWGSGKVIGLLVATVLLIASWIVIEKRAVSPLIDMVLMARKPVWTNNLVALLLGVGTYAVMAFLPQYLQTPRTAGYGFGASVTVSGLILLPFSGLVFLSSILVSPLARRIGYKAVVVAGCALFAVAIFAMAFAHHHIWQLLLADAVMGIGVGFPYAAVSALIVSVVPPDQVGVATGMNANIRTIGGSIGSALMASMVTARLHPDGLPYESGYTNGFVLLGAAMVVAAVVALIIPNTAHHEVRDVEFDDGLPSGIAIAEASGD